MLQAKSLFFEIFVFVWKQVDFTWVYKHSYCIDHVKLRKWNNFKCLQSVFKSSVSILESCLRRIGHSRNTASNSPMRAGNVVDEPNLPKVLCFCTICKSKSMGTSRFESETILWVQVQTNISCDIELDNHPPNIPCNHSTKILRLNIFYVQIKLYLFDSIATNCTFLDRSIVAKFLRYLRTRLLNQSSFHNHVLWQFDEKWLFIFLKQ